MVLGVVVHGAVRQEPVLPVQQGRPGLFKDVGPAALRQDGPGAGEDAEDHHDDGGQQALEQMQPVAQQPQRRAAFDLPREAECHQEGRNEEEDVHAAGDPAQPHVVRDHHEDREGAKALDFGAVACFSGRRRTCVRPWRGDGGSLVRHKIPFRTGFQNINVIET